MVGECGGKIMSDKVTKRVMVIGLGIFGFNLKDLYPKGLKSLQSTKTKRWCRKSRIAVQPSMMEIRGDGIIGIQGMMWSLFLFGGLAASTLCSLHTRK
jgi:hypothetical protein